MRLSYCTNVHPAEDLDGVLAQLDACAGPVRERLGLQRLGVGLWLPADLVARLASLPSALRRLRARTEHHGLEVTTLNAFPYSGFHDDVVKGAVYSPSWTDPLRAAYTLQCAQVLAELLPEGAEGSVSTLPLGWREPWTDADDAAAQQALHRVGAGLAALARRTGRTVRLAVEPEPGCVLDTAADAVRWLAAHGTPGGADGTVDLDLVGLCLDTCHLATSFEDPGEVVASAQAAGVRVVKVQASAALEAADPADPATRAALEGYAEPRYLHQVRERTPQGVRRVDDLPDALAGPPAAGPWRVHVHMPLGAEPAAPLRTTSDVLVAAVHALRDVHGAAALAQVPLDVETYTWSVLPGASPGAEPAQPRRLAAADLVEGIAGELAWARATLGEVLTDADRAGTGLVGSGAVGSGTVGSGTGAAGQQVRA